MLYILAKNVTNNCISMPQYLMNSLVVDSRYFLTLLNMCVCIGVCVFTCVFTCVCACVFQCYLQQPRAPSEVWLSRLLSVSEVTVGSLLGSLGSVDMEETSLAEEEEDAG